MKMHRLDPHAIASVYKALIPDAEQRSARVLADYCPFCHDLTKRLFTSTTNGSWHCYQCGAGGDLIDFVAGMEHLDRNRAEGRLLALLANREDARPVEATRAPAPATPPDMTEPSSEAPAEALEQAPSRETIAHPHPADTLLVSTCKTGRCKGAIAISSEEYGFAAIQQRGEVPFEPRRIRKLTALLDQSLARACKVVGEQTCDRGSVSLAAQLEGQRIQILWYPIRIKEIDSALFILDRGSTEQLLVRAVESWRKEHGYHT